MALQLCILIVLLSFITLIGASDVANYVSKIQWGDEYVEVYNKPSALFRESEDCFAGFLKGIHRNDTCYMFVTITKSWQDATDFCQSYFGFGLVTVESYEEQEVFVGHLGTDINLRVPAGQRGGYWTSGNKMRDGTTWEWQTTGEPFNFTKWIPGHPDSNTVMVLFDDNSGNYACIAHYFDWISQNPATAYRSICQHPILE
ncbi:unnamed protein product [Owenia fusiformis]|uniref:C-type lectin domain-containing protein n=1 Tax=Owenia fusiformis TaxID=6347 RepID=A0A8S4Q3N2_OWEFU|nr:unnamed protein product [Owenia fusiformis]